MKQLINATDVYFFFIAKTKENLPKGISKYRESFKYPGMTEYELSGEYILIKSLPLESKAIELALKEDGFKDIDW